MSLVQFNKVSKYYSGQEILNEISFSIKTGEKLALTGLNGSGKTTIMKLISKEEETDQGQIFLRTGISIGYSEQVFDYSEDRDLFNYVLSSFAHILQMRDDLSLLEEKISRAKEDDLDEILLAYARLQEKYEQENGYSIESKSRQILAGLGFKSDEFTKKFSILSGGEKRRASLARLLVSQPDLLLLDEPTNHLDLAGIEWLEKFLAAWPSTLLVISHDSYFLDSFVDRVLEINNKKIRSWPGNFSSYIFLKKEKDKADQRAFEKQEKEVRNIQEYIRRYKAGIKAKQARGRQKQLDRKILMEEIFQEREIRLSFKEAPYSGRDVLQVKNLHKEIHPKLRIEDFNLHLRRGEALAIIGPNGSGKTSLLKTLLNEDQDLGEIRWGSSLKIAYFDQEHKALDPEKTLLNEIIDNYDISIEAGRQLLASLLFYQDDMEKKVKTLSGGEKSRLLFAKMVLDQPNLLILDEPTNHLDIDSKEVIIEALLGFDGTILFVSHDRLLLDLLADRLIDLGQAKQEGEEVEEERKLIKKDIKEKKEEKAKRLNPFQLKKRLKEIEEEINILEERIKEISQILENPDLSDFSLYEKYAKDMEEAQEAVDYLMEEWAELEEEDGN